MLPLQERALVEPSHIPGIDMALPDLGLAAINKVKLQSYNKLQ